MIVHNFDPILIDFGIIQIRWYSLAYVVGILLGWWYGRAIIKRKTNQTNQQNYLSNFDDLIGYLIIGIIFGGRIGYVLFYSPSFYFENPFEIFKIWKGGMSFHGGLAGVIFTTYFFSIRKNLNYKLYFDTISCVAPIGIFFGRIANFINGELYGLPTEKPWGIVFPEVDNLMRHPSQLYEALLEGIILFIILNFLIFKKVLRHGKISFLFLILYGVFRIVCENFRVPDEHIGYLVGNFSMGSILSVVMIIFGIFFFTKVISNEENK